MKLVAALSMLALWQVGGKVAEPIAPLGQEEARTLADPAGYRAPTIVALWSPDCAGCKRNLAVFASLTRSDSRVRMITVAAEPVGPLLAGPLDRLGVPGRRFALGSQPAPGLAAALDAQWTGDLPRTLFFDGRGGRRAISGMVNEATARRELGLLAAN